MSKRNRRKKRKNQGYPKENRCFKDRLFRKVFTNRKDLLDLYNAVNGTTMNLYEHQSSYNPNMPIRGFLCFARLYQNYMEGRKLNLYGSSLQKLPLPRYLVFYNGAWEEPDKTELRLTDAFGGMAEGKEPCLECVATMLNINYGHNKEIMEKCKRLEEYAVFVAVIRRHIVSKLVL